LEHSRLDNAAGKRFWSSNDPAQIEPTRADQPAPGVLQRVGEMEMLEVFILIERFDNGTEPYLRMRFRADRPYEVGLATFSRAGSAPMTACVLTATMGNYARLRQLYLADKVVTSADLWPDYRGAAFTPHARFPLRDLSRTPQRHVLVAATTDEPDPQQARYAPLTEPHWRYSGKVATQYWRCEKPDAAMVAAVVNGRFTYWLSDAPIPGGIAFENFELVQPHTEGGEVWFGVTPKKPEELGISPRLIR